jgi:hypothetical protein
MRRFLEGRKWWDEAAEQELKDRYKKEVMAEFRRAEGLKRQPLGELFTDVYGGEMPWNLVSGEGCLRGLVHQWLIAFPERAEGGTRWVAGEVWECMGAMEKGEREV